MTGEKSFNFFDIAEIIVDTKALGAWVIKVRLKPIVAKTTQQLSGSWTLEGKNIRISLKFWTKSRYRVDGSYSPCSSRQLHWHHPHKCIRPMCRPLGKTKIFLLSIAVLWSNDNILLSILFVFCDTHCGGQSYWIVLAGYLVTWLYMNIYIWQSYLHDVQMTRHYLLLLLFIKLTIENTLGWPTITWAKAANVIQWPSSKHNDVHTTLSIVPIVSCKSLTGDYFRMI
uniref:Uncharacterized protein n=1 Tax=Glossina pallidipes TaxID=7398 RepID=A0A1B0A0Q5_GLOPL